MSFEMEYLSTFLKVGKNVLGVIVLSVPKTIAVLVIYKRTHRTQNIVIFIAMIIITIKGIQSKISKGRKAHGAKSGGNQAQASKGPLPIELHRLIPPASSCENICKISTREAQRALKSRVLIKC